jgi:hypothetical protein
LAEVTFSDLVREAFIDPLRSVLIVDDQYPTWEEIFTRQPQATDQNASVQVRKSKKEWVDDPNGPLGVIKQFRNKKRGFVIDIYDGQQSHIDAQSEASESEAIGGGVVEPDHLHQSDLLVLDYNLEGAQSGLGGEKAREILRSVLTNRHFNLIALHTAEKNLTEVFHQCLFYLMPSCTSKFDEKTQKSIDDIEKEVSALEQGEAANRNDILKSFTNEKYLLIRKSNLAFTESLRDFMQLKGILSEVAAAGDDLEFKTGKLKSFFYWAIREFEKSRNISNFSTFEHLDEIKWKATGDRIWIRTSRGFVAFIRKNTADILGELQKCIEDWEPTPSRLISAKYRSELSGAGVVAEDRTLSKRHAFAYFYKDLKKPGHAGISEIDTHRLRLAKLKSHITGKSEALTSVIEDAVIEFAETIRDTEEKTGSDFEAHYGLLLSEDKELSKARAHYNSYVSTLSLKPGNEQLDSGHIFELDGNWWVCATPACDLQLGQNTTAFVGSSASLRPFTALLLERAGNDFEKITNDHINSGVFCFVETKLGEVECFGLQKMSDTNPFQNGKVTWRTFAAEKGGLISEGKLMITVPKLAKDTIAIETGREAKVVAKLRYEYALNFIQRVGTSVTRIGLGYSS